MNRPSSTDFMLGRRGSAPALSCLAVLAIYAAATDRAPWLLAGLVVYLAHAARKARARVVAYTQWAEAWNEMAGVAPEQREPRSSNGRLTLRRAVGIALWAYPALWLSQNPALSGTPTYAGFAGAFALTTVGGLGALLLSAFRRHRGAGPARATRAPKAKRAPDVVVTVCLPVSRNSPNVRRIVPALPDFCRALLERQAAPPRAAATPESPPN
jgi:hypothetical protein